MGLGFFQLLLIAAILFVLVGIPLAIIALVIVLAKRNANSHRRDNRH